MEEGVSMSCPICYSKHGGLFKDKYLFMHSLIICPGNKNIPWTILRTPYNCFCQLFFFMRKESIFKSVLNGFVYTFATGLISLCVATDVVCKPLLRDNVGISCFLT